jgi:hypothetical protein
LAALTALTGFACGLLAQLGGTGLTEALTLVVDLHLIEVGVLDGVIGTDHVIGWVLVVHRHHSNGIAWMITSTRSSSVDSMTATSVSLPLVSRHTYRMLPPG